MKQTSLLLILLICAFTNSLQAQIVEFGKINPSELEATKDLKFPDAPAVVLYRSVESYLGNYVEVHERIKIYNEEGYEYATVFIPYPKIRKVKGATYNLVNGAVVKTELDKDLIFDDEVIKDVEFKKFTFPNVSPGSVLEYTYITSEWSAENIVLQMDIPIRKERVEFTNRLDLGVEILQNPRAFLDVNRIEESKGTKFLLTDVPALEPENFVYDMDLYRSFLRTNLTAVGYKYKFNNFESLGGHFLADDDFRGGLKPKGFFEDDLTAVVQGETDNLKIAEKVYDFVKKKVKWNKKYGVVPNKSTRDIYKEGEGNSAGINVLFISMLRSLGINANPVMVSTRQNGIPLSASTSAFNSCIADVQIGQKNYLIDVASKNSTFHFMDIRYMNYQGFRIHADDTYKWVDLERFNNSTWNIIANAKITDDKTFEGTVKERHSGYFGIGLLNELEDIGSDNTKDVITYKSEGLEIFDEETNNEKGETVDLNFAFEMESGIDEIDGKLLFSPLMFFALNESPFKKENRKYAIDFNYPFKKQVMISIDIPEGYAVESLPEPTKISVEGMGSYIIRVNSAGNKIQVMASFQIDTHILPFDKYDEVRGFYRARMEKEAEKVVLQKV